MLKILGIIFLLTGSTGAAWCFCNDERERIKQIKEIRRIYHLVQNEIIYVKASIPDLCQSLAEKAEPPYAEAFKEIYQEIKKNNGRSFSDIWQDIMGIHIRKTLLKEEEKKLLLDFPECLGYLDKEGQAGGLERFINEADAVSSRLEKEIANKTKVMMSLGMMSGILLILLLL